MRSQTPVLKKEQLKKDEELIDDQFERLSNVEKADLYLNFLISNIKMCSNNNLAKIQNPQLKSTTQNEVTSQIDLMKKQKNIVIKNNQLTNHPILANKQPEKKSKIKNQTKINHQQCKNDLSKNLICEEVKLNSILMMKHPTNQPLIDPRLSKQENQDNYANNVLYVNNNILPATSNQFVPFHSILISKQQSSNNQAYNQQQFSIGNSYVPAINQQLLYNNQLDLINQQRDQHLFNQCYSNYLNTQEMMQKNKDELNDQDKQLNTNNQDNQDKQLNETIRPSINNILGSSNVTISNSKVFDLSRLIVPSLKEDYSASELKRFLDDLADNVLDVNTSVEYADLSRIVALICKNYITLLRKNGYVSFIVSFIYSISISLIIKNFYLFIGNSVR